jgi:two-component system, NarL family, response regulator LiaR
MTELSAARPIRVVLVDDHAVLRKGMCALLDREPGLEVAGEAEDGEQAVHAADRLRPDVILMDLEMKGIGGIEATRRITATRPENPSPGANESYGRRGRIPGFEGRCDRLSAQTLQSLDVLDAIRQAHRGETVLHPTIARMVLQELHRPAHTKQLPTGEALSDREVDVLRLLARGMSNHEIADTLVLSEATVRTHVSSILRKLQLASLMQAALYALREGTGIPSTKLGRS